MRHHSLTCDGFAGGDDGPMLVPSHPHHAHHTLSPSSTPQCEYTPTPRDPHSDIETTMVSAYGQTVSSSSPEFLIRLLPLVAQRVKEAKKLGEITPSTHPLNTSPQPTLSIHPLNPPSQYIPINPLSQYIPINPPSQYIPSTHPIDFNHD